MASQEPKYNPPPTTFTTLQILAGPDTPLRRRRVEQIAAVYQPIMTSVARLKMGKNWPVEDSEDLASNEVVKMLSVESDYFQTFNKDKSRLRAWIKLNIRSRTIDYIRRRKNMEVATDYSGLEFSDKGSEMDVAHLDEVINLEEFYAVFRTALTITKKHFDETAPEKFHIFESVRSEAKFIPKEKRRKEWSEWTERRTVREVWNHIRDVALPQAAELIAEDPEDATNLLQECWDRLKNKQTLDLS